ncbi:hypothetical protein VKT23_007936 [Stygiomarasmius scandens]|uniref:Heterokaryon incompatibility domain-containing protein n=1 Tax=Marasmiellus scandens TaxID=2682957 RepID=A0ABR1JNI1_9AGAR
MRLLNTKSFKVEEFYTKIPLYAILSHTWEEEEVSFQDIQNLEFAKTKTGWSKVHHACAYAQKYMFDWIWIDSCCIDKSSSAELSEAINSMYRYYENAEVCYVYLCDALKNEDPTNPKSAFRNSKWFTRGWTLQELIAPLYAVFLVNNIDGTDHEWTEIGTRWSLRDTISAITSIPVQIFEGRSVDEFSIAQKMSWAAFRETTRPEDQAYCLMGIFNVSMPPLYGEGSTKAFMRLQQEIIKISDDRSIFAWISRPEDPSELRGLLARSPIEFRASGTVGIPRIEELGHKSSFSFTNNGLRIHLPIKATSDNKWLASLHCCSIKDGVTSNLSVSLQRIGEQHYVRCYPHEVFLESSPPQSKDLQEITVKESSPPRNKGKGGNIRRHHFFRLKILPSAQNLLNPVNDGTLDMGSFNVSVDRMNRAIKVKNKHFARLHLTYHAGRTSGVFYIAFGSQNKIGTVAVASEAIEFNRYPSIFNGVPIDRVALYLKDVGLVSVSLQMTGQQRSEKVLEINHQPVESRFPVATSLSTTLRLSTLQPPSSGFRVPLYHTYGKFARISLETVFPPSFFDCGLESSRSRGGYILMPLNDNTPFRLISYKCIKPNQFSLKFYVALGFHKTGEAWIDIFTEDLVKGSGGQENTLETIWKYYCALASRKNVGFLRIAALKTWWVGMEATLQKSATLQLGSHSLSLELRSY